MHPTTFEIYICPRNDVLKNGLSDLGHVQNPFEHNDFYAIKKESNGTLWYAKYHYDKEDIIGSWAEIKGVINSDKIKLIPKFKRSSDGLIKGLNRVYLYEIFRQGDEHIGQIIQRKAGRPA